MKDQYPRETSPSHIHSPYNMVIKVRSDIFQKYLVKMDRTNIQEDAKTITVENSKMFGRDQENKPWFDARKMLLGINDSGNDPTKIDLTKIKNNQETNKKVIAANLTKIRKMKRKPLESVILRKSVRFSNNLKDSIPNYLSSLPSLCHSVNYEVTHQT